MPRRVNEQDWTMAKDGSPIHVRSWGAGVRQGILFGVAGGFGIGGALVALAWYFFG